MYLVSRRPWWLGGGGSPGSSQDVQVPVLVQLSCQPFLGGGVGPPLEGGPHLAADSAGGWGPLCVIATLDHWVSLRVSVPQKLELGQED